MGCQWRYGSGQTRGVTTCTTRSYKLITRNHILHRPPPSTHHNNHTTQRPLHTTPLVRTTITPRTTPLATTDHTTLHTIPLGTTTPHRAHTLAIVQCTSTLSVTTFVEGSSTRGVQATRLVRANHWIGLDWSGVSFAWEVITQTIDTEDRKYHYNKHTRTQTRTHQCTCTGTTRT